MSVSRRKGGGSAVAQKWEKVERKVLSRRESVGCALTTLVCVVVFIEVGITNSFPHAGRVSEVSVLAYC